MPGGGTVNFLNPTQMPQLIEPLPKIDSSATSPKRRRWVLRLGLAALLFLLGIVLIILPGYLEGSETRWYTQSEFARAVKSDLVSKVKNLVLNSRLAQRFLKPSKQISFQNCIFTLPAGSDSSSVLGIPSSTNSEGARLWILSPLERDRLASRVKSSKDIKLITGPNITTSDQTAFQVGMPPGNPPMPQMAVVCFPKIQSDKIKLMLSAVSMATETNFIGSCRCLIPDSGAMVMDCRDAKHLSGDSPFIMVSLYLINPDGSRVFDPTDPSKQSGQ